MTNGNAASKVAKGKPKPCEPPQPPSETHLIRDVLTGRTEAYGRIFSRYQDTAFAVALGYTRNREDALDVVQDAFIKAFVNLRRFDLNRRFGPWLMSIVRNLAIDLLRRRKILSHEVLPDGLADRRALDRVDHRVVRREVAAALSRLDPKQREILCLREYLGYSYLEIAEALGIPLGTVMSRLHQSRRNFKRVLRQAPRTALSAGVC